VCFGAEGSNAVHHPWFPGVTVKRLTYDRSFFCHNFWGGGVEPKKPAPTYGPE